MAGFSETVKEHFRYPRNFGELERPDGVATINNPVCGDVTEFYLKLEGGKISDVKFRSAGSTVTIASASIFTEKIRGRDVSELLSGDDGDAVSRLLGMIEDELGELPAHKLHCTPAIVQVFLEAVSDYYEKQGEAITKSRIKRLLPFITVYYKRGRE